jgi:hypothetical protein
LVVRRLLAVLWCSSRAAVAAGQAPALEVDHIYLVVAPGGWAERRILAEAGIRVDTGVARHTGQGTASVAAYFENAYLELLWVDSSVAVDRAHQQDFRGFQRASGWPRSQASPFGIGLHRTSGTGDDFGVPARIVGGDWLRPGTHYVLLRQPAESLATDVFVVPDDRAVPAWAGRAKTRYPGLFEHPSRVRRLTRVSLHGPPHQVPEALRRLRPALLTVEETDQAWMEIELDGGAAGVVHDLRPRLPIVLRR